MTLSLDDFRPQPTVVRPETLPVCPSMPFIETDNHLGRFGGNWDKRTPQGLFAHLQRAGLHAALRGPHSVRRRCQPKRGGLGDLYPVPPSAGRVFSYSSAPVPGQRRWMIHALHLRQDVLEAIYHDNAARLPDLQAADSGRHPNRADELTHEGTDETP